MDIIQKLVIRFKKRPIFGISWSIVEISSNGSQIAFTPDDSVRYILGFKPKVVYEKYNSSGYPDDILAFDNIFLETDIAQGMISKRKRSALIHIFTMDVDPCYKFIEKFRGGIQCCKMESKGFNSTIIFKLKTKKKSTSII